MRKIVYLNAGHGGLHPESRKYMTFPSHGKFYHFTDNLGEITYSAYEGETNRIFAEKLNLELSTQGIEVLKVYHPYMDRYNQERVFLANQHYRKYKALKALWLSFHSNAYGMSSKGASLAPQGFSIFTSEGDTDSDRAAELIFNQVKAEAKLFGISYRTDYRDRQADFDINFDELYFTDMPAVLIENLFFTNIKDAQLLKNPEYQKAIAKAVCAGIMQFFK
jgi:N-acetylmuramoyl-L-alanine amidase